MNSSLHSRSRLKYRFPGMGVMTISLTEVGLAMRPSIAAWIRSSIGRGVERGISRRDLTRGTTILVERPRSGQAIVPIQGGAQRALRIVADI